MPTKLKNALTALYDSRFRIRVKLRRAHNSSGPSHADYECRQYRLARYPRTYPGNQFDELLRTEAALVTVMIGVKSWLMSCTILLG